NYEASLLKNQEKTGMSEAIVSGTGRIDGLSLGVAVTDSHFIMGSMGSVVGERIMRTIERSIEREMPALLVSGSGGGARMQEGLLSLMEMANTSEALARVKQAGLLCTVLLTDPTMGGVFASWASLGDVLIAEPGAMIGFAGQRVSQQTSVMKPPPDFQTAEFQFKHGMIDLVCPRKELRDTLIRLLQFGSRTEAPAPFPLGSGPDRPTSGSSLYPGLHPPHLRRIPGTARRPPVRRRCRHRGRDRAPGAALAHRDRSPEGPRHPRAQLSQFRQRPARGL